MSEDAARTLRIELSQLVEAEKALSGLSLIDPSERLRLERIREAIAQRSTRLAGTSRKE